MEARVSEGGRGERATTREPYERDRGRDESGVGARTSPVNMPFTAP